MHKEMRAKKQSSTKERNQTATTVITINVALRTLSHKNRKNTVKIEKKVCGISVCTTINERR